MTKTTKTLADFKAAHDPDTVIPNKIKAALASLLKEGPESWEYEADFLRRASVANSQIATYRDQFAEFIVDTNDTRATRGKRVWFADQKVAKRARGQ